MTSFAKQVNDECKSAVENCPHSIQADNWDAYEQIGDGGVVVDELPRQGLKATLNYWTNVQTLGGSTLFESGYYQDLSDEVLEALREHMTGGDW